MTGHEAIKAMLDAYLRIGDRVDENGDVDLKCPARCGRRNKAPPHEYVKWINGKGHPPVCDECKKKGSRTP